MKILAVGDFHGKFPEKLKNIAKECDFVLSTGDLGGNDELLKIIFKYFKEKWWDKIGKEESKSLVLDDYSKGKKIIDELSLLGKEVYIIPGNWDFTVKSPAERTAGLELVTYPRIINQKSNLHYINRNFRKIKNLNILFFGNMVTAGAYTENGTFEEKKVQKFYKKNKNETEQLFKYVNKKIDILLAHYPPFGYFDKVKFKGDNPMKGKHVGFKGYTEFIKKNQPRLFICGHMHEYQGIKKLGKTLIVATGAAKDGKAAIINCDEKFSVEFIN